MPYRRISRRYLPKKWWNCRRIFLKEGPFTHAVTGIAANLCDCLVKIPVRRAAGRGYSYFHLYVFLRLYLFIYVCHASWPNEKRYRPEIWYTHFPRPYLKMAFFVYSRRWPRGPLGRKTAVSRGFSGYLLEWLVLFFTIAKNDIQFFQYVEWIDLKLEESLTSSHCLVT